MSEPPDIDVARLAAIGKHLSDQLEELATLPEQIEICSALMVAALLQVPVTERRRHMETHLRALGLIARQMPQ